MGEFVGLAVGDEVIGAVVGAAVGCRLNEKSVANKTNGVSGKGK